MEKRRLGRLDIELSVIGFGGIVADRRTQAEADREVVFAIDHGVNYFDVSPTYGAAQQRLAQALAGRRDRVVLSCKTTQRTAEAAKAEMAESLRVFGTEYFDLYQMHGISRAAEMAAALGPGGAIETFLSAKRRGLARWIGFSSHDEPSALMAIESGHFDLMMIPLNFFVFTRGRLGPASLEAARRKGMGVVALKAMARGVVPRGQAKPYVGCWYQPEDDPAAAELLVRWTLSLPGVTTAIPPGNPKLFRMMVEMAERLAPIDQAGIDALRARQGFAEPLFTVQ